MKTYFHSLFVLNSRYDNVNEHAYYLLSPTLADFFYKFFAIHRNQVLETYSQ